MANLKQRVIGALEPLSKSYPRIGQVITHLTNESKIKFPKDDFNDLSSEELKKLVQFLATITDEIPGITNAPGSESFNQLGLDCYENLYKKFIEQSQQQKGISRRQ
jgi:hypothetical protein